MSETVIQIEDLSKKYQLGAIGHRLLYRDLQSWWARLWGKEDPNSRLHELPRVNEHNGLGSFFALKNINLEVKEGEILGIIGTNGAGKSTLLKILSRITAPTEGFVRIKGRVASLLEVGTGFHPELTGRENIYLNGAIHGMSKSETSKKLHQIVEFAEIEQFLNTPVKRYSSGMYVRLAFAVAAHLDPEILLVDEVLAVGDAGFQRKCLQKMNEVSVSGHTILFVSHAMASISRLCSRAILLDKGCIAKEGETADVIGTYLGRIAEAKGRREWNLENAPGDNRVCLLSVTVSSNGCTSTGIVDIRDEVHVAVGYYVKKENILIRCSIGFMKDGFCAFSALEPIDRRRTHIGHYTSFVKIPANFLNTGEYTLALALCYLGSGKEVYAEVRDVISFRVLDSSLSTDTARGDYTWELGGAVRPKLQWDSTFDGR